ncbi:uncharacterized protein LOC109823003 [Asparagus officinalis]|uniref:uncharacterized protein LOC109823003 n=1 Tax=Asparagus officinalis TaxID=4686 RepID=UPI00098E0DBC|nr:uncharacterized protein LOC109823003 [Asparagus officinalis]
MWVRITTLYHQNVKDFGGDQRSQRSLESRWDLIKKVINKFRGCIRQIERLNPSGASELDIIIKAKALYEQESKDKKEFQYEHIWHILKDAEKWADPTPSKMTVSGTMSNAEGSESNSMDCINLMGDEQSPTNASSSRPVGRKTEKAKRKIISPSECDVDILKNIKEMQEKRELGRDTMQQLMMMKLENDKKKLDQRAVQLEQRNQLLAQQRAQFHLERDREDREILSIDLSKIVDVREHAFFERKKQQIISRNSGDFQFDSSTHVSGGTGYWGPSGYQYGTGSYGNDLPEF